MTNELGVDLKYVGCIGAKKIIGFFMSGFEQPAT